MHCVPHLIVEVISTKKYFCNKKLLKKLFENVLFPLTQKYHKSLTLTSSKFNS